MSTTWKYFLLVILILLLGSIPLAMQRDAGAIEGVVIDDHSAAIAGATVEARNTMSGVVFPAIADASGNYKINGLPQGRYSLWVKAAGHDSVWLREVIVDRGQTVRRDIRLAVSESPIPSGGAE
jgi:Carboxypeptidase regulatory-like domain